MYDLVKRENEIFRTLTKFLDKKLIFLIVGGYAVSAYKHRFSIDSDVVIKKEDLERFEKILIEDGYKKTIFKKLKNIYSSEFIRYEKKEFKVSIDLLINGVSSRTTDAVFSFEFLLKHSEKRLIKGMENSIEANVPNREILIILKFHSGRLTDLRDIAALAYNLDFSVIKNNIFAGKQDIVKQNIRKLLLLIDKKEFIDSFKGVFIEKRFDVDIEEIRKLRKLLS